MDCRVVAREGEFLKDSGGSRLSGVNPQGDRWDRSPGPDRRLTKDARHPRHEWLTIGFVVRYAVFLLALALVAMAVWPGWCRPVSTEWVDCAWDGPKLFLWWPIMPLRVCERCALNVFAGAIWWALLALAFDVLWAVCSISRRKAAESVNRQG